MASRSFNRKQSLEKEIKEIYAKVAIGSSGAPTLSTVSTSGVASIVRNSAGNYTLTLQDKYISLKSVQISHLASSAQDLQFQLLSETVDSTKTISFVCQTDATATDPASGTTLLIQINLKNTTAV